MARFLAQAQSEPSVFQILIRTRSMLVWVNRRFAATSLMAMVFISRPMEERLGSESAWKIRVRSHAFEFIRRTRTLFTWLRLVTFGGRTISEACFVRRMVAKRGKRS